MKPAPGHLQGFGSAGKSLVRWNKGGFVKQDLREALPKVRNPPSFTLRKE